MRAEGTARLRTDFVPNDQAKGYPVRLVEAMAGREELDEFVRASRCAGNCWTDEPSMLSVRLSSVWR